MNHKKSSHFFRSIAAISLIILALVLMINCKKGVVSQADLIVLTISQQQWGLNYSSSMGHVEIFLQGDSVDGIILGSIEMKGDNPSAAPLKPDSADFVGATRVRALFEKNKVLALLANPSEGSIHVIIVCFKTEPSSESFEVSAQVTVSDYVEDGETSPLTLEIDPVEWSLNYTNSAGTVEAFIRGEGIDQVDLNSLEMVGDNPDAASLPAMSTSINNDHIHARFAKNQVIGLLLDPAPGTTHTIIVSYLLNGGTERMELSAIITIEDDDDIIDPTELTLEIDPVEWSLNFTNSSGTVEAFIRGEGFDQIDLSSIEMKGDNLTAAPLAAESASINGDHVHARFPKNQVIGLLSNPEPGSTHTIIVSFLPIGGTERIELTAEITIEDDDDIIDPDDLRLVIDPVEWSLNFTNSSGTVEAFIRGEGFDQIDLSSIQMKGDNSTAAPLAASSASISGDHVHARFPKNQVIALLSNPEPGSTHTIIISFFPIGGTDEDRIELTAEITIEDDDDEEPEPSDLTLQLNPSTWNMNYSGSSGTVTAKIQGTGIEDIDLASIEMAGDNTAAESLSATSAKLSGNHINADFPKNKVLDLLLSPAKGTTHTVTVSFMKGGTQEELTAQVRIE
jgi:hypothetical protein